MDRMIDKTKSILVYIVIVTLPIMALINVLGKLKINMSLSDFFAAVIVLLTVIDYKNFSLKKNFPYWWYFAGMMGLMIISNTLAYFNPNIVSGSILSALNEFIKFAIAGVYFFIGYNCIDREDKVVKILRVWTYSALFVSVIGMAVLFNTDVGLLIHPDIPIQNLKTRLYGTLTDPNLAATYLSISFYIALLFNRIAKNRADKWISYVALVLLAASVVLTQSRSGIIAFSISILLFGIFNIRRLYRYISIFILIAFIGYFGILDLDAIYLNKQISNTLDKRFEEVSEGTGETLRRLNLSKAAFMMGKDHFFIGVGRGNYPLNSGTYYRRLGIDTTTWHYTNQFKFLIPHNTYMAFFAELGLFGMLLFLSIFILILKLHLKRNYTNIIFISLLVSYFVQAFAVNLENFRGIWFVLGIAYIFGNKLVSNNCSREYKSYNLKLSKVFMWNVALFFLGILVFINTIPYYTNPLSLDDELQSQDITNLRSNEKYIFRYFIKTKTESMDKPTSQISVYGVDNYNTEVLLNEITYYEPNGYGNLLFTLDDSIKSVRIKINPLSKKDTTVTINDAMIINTHTGTGQRVFADYKYLHNSIENFVGNIGLIKTIIKTNTSSYRLFANKVIDNDTIVDYSEKESIKYFDGNNPINLSNKILFLGAKLEQQSPGQAKITFFFKCIGNMDVDYYMWLHGLPIDKAILPKAVREDGIVYWDHTLKLKTTEWQVGSIYEDAYIINCVPGQYGIEFGLWNSKWKDGKTYRLNPGIYLGSSMIK